MRRSVLFTVAVFAVSVPAFGQSSSTYSAAVPPSTEQLDRLRLKTEWAIHLPVDSRMDRLTNVQVVDRGQLFAQTTSGTVLALDAQSGQRQWSFRFPSGRGTPLPVAVNSRYVFIANLSRLYCFHRFSGVLEFSFEPTVKLDIPMATITTGPVCDEAHVYVVLGNHEVLAYRLPSSVTQPEKDSTRTAASFGAKDSKPNNPADEIGKRYPGQGKSTAQVDPPTRSRGLNRPNVTVNTHQISPSIGLLPSVVMPYEFKDRNGLSILRTESISTLNSLRQPYQIKDGEGRYVVKTPSITVIPPSVARAYELNDIRPKGLSPTKIWRYEATSKIAFEPILAGARMWLSFESPRAIAIDRVDLSQVQRTVQTDGTLSAAAATGIAADGSTGYFALGDGSIISVDLSFGGNNNMGALKEMWRSNVGGPMNRKPVVTPTSLFVGGMSSGIGRINRKDGVLAMRTAPDDDFLLAVNDDSAYTRSRSGILRVYDLQSPVDPSTKRTAPVGEINLAAFGISIANTMTDRIFLAADNGLLVCLRDSAPKYAVAKPTLPPKPAPVPVKKEGEVMEEKPAAAPAPVKPVEAAPKPPMNDKKPDAPKS